MASDTYPTHPSTLVIGPVDYAVLKIGTPKAPLTFVDDSETAVFQLEHDADLTYGPDGGIFQG